MHDLAFADAIRPRPVVILRLPMLPYSIGHEILLVSERNAFLTESRSDFDALPVGRQASELRKAVLICSKTWAENNRRDTGLRFWTWLIRKDNIPLAIAEFRNYIQESHSGLPAPDPEADQMANGAENIPQGRALGSPYLAQLVNFIAASKLSVLSQGSQLLDFPYAPASILYQTYLESEGAIRVENWKEYEIKTEMAAHRAAFSAEQAANPEVGQPATTNSVGLATPPPNLGPDQSVSPKTIQHEKGASK